MKTAPYYPVKKYFVLFTFPVLTDQRLTTEELTIRFKRVSEKMHLESLLVGLLVSVLGYFIVDWAREKLDIEFWFDRFYVAAGISVALSFWMVTTDYINKARYWFAEVGATAPQFEGKYRTMASLRATVVVAILVGLLTAYGENVEATLTQYVGQIGFVVAVAGFGAFSYWVGGNLQLNYINRHCLSIQTEFTT